MTILKVLSEELSEEAGEPNWFAITDAAERTVFEEKGLYPNVDLYSASFYRYLGVPTDPFTPLVAATPVPRPPAPRTTAPAPRGDTTPSAASGR